MGRGDGRASAALPLLEDVVPSPASRRLASARPALAPKCQLILARALSIRFAFSANKLYTYLYTDTEVKSYDGRDRSFIR
jgi:hypothetical protein